MSSQDYFAEEAKEKAGVDEHAVNRRVFIPEEPGGVDDGFLG